MQMTNNKAKLPDGTPFHYATKAELNYIYKEIFDSKCYEHELIDYRNADLIFDVGANVGLFLLFISRKCSQSTIYAFEPIAEIYQVLRQNAKNISQSDLRLINAGLAGSSGTTNFIYLPNCASRSSRFMTGSPAEQGSDAAEREKRFARQCLIENPNRVSAFLTGLLPGFLQDRLAENIMNKLSEHREVSCRLTTISQVIAENKIQNIDLIKIDAECSESEIMRGIQAEDWHKIQQLIIETHPGMDQSTKEIPRFLETKGFQVAVETNPLFPEVSLVFASR